MEIFLIRHTAVQCQTAFCYGQSDVELATTYEAEKEAIRSRLSLRAEAVCYSSPLTRCLTLAEDLACGELIVDERLKELHFGDWELKAWEAINQPLLQAWMQDFVHYRVPQGESFTELYARSVHFWQDLLQRAPEQAVVVTHAGVIRSLLCYVLEMPLQNAFRLRVDSGSVTKVSVKNGFSMLDSLNR